jgi:hypothetical protein
MKRKIVISIAIFVPLAVVLTVIYRDVEHLAWSAYAESTIANLAEYMELYKEVHGAYPDSIRGLTADPNFATNELVNSALSAQNGTQYSYMPSNGIFSITAVRAKKLFSGEKKIIKSYRPGEANRTKVLPNREIK